MSIESGFGTGKTHFSTRFCQHLNNNKITAVYLSAWEYDYLTNPFLFIAKEITEALNRSKLSKTKRFVENITERAIKDSEAVTLTVGIPKIGEINCSPTSALKTFFEPLESKDPIIEFKNFLTKAIKKLSEQKLVIIVDELDRCRPDYAIKVLETIKHFFDIEGLCILLPISKVALNNAITSVYGKIIAEPDQEEEYLTKFITVHRFLPSVDIEDYKKVAYNQIKTGKLKNAFSNGVLTLEENFFNSFNLLLDSLSLYGVKAKLTMRQFVNKCRETIIIVNSMKTPIIAEFFAFVICEIGMKGYPISYDFNESHPLKNRQEIYTFVKDQVSRIENAVYDFKYGYPSHRWSTVFSNLLYRKFDEHSNFESICKYVDDFNKSANEYQNNESCKDYEAKDLNNIVSILNDVKSKVLNYQKRYGNVDIITYSNLINLYKKLIYNPLNITE